MRYISQIFLLLCSITLSLSTAVDTFFTSVPLLEECPKVFSDKTNGRENVVDADIFYLTTQNVYFSVQQEENPSQVSITYWKSSQVTQVLPGVLNCFNIRFDESKDSLLLTCSANDVYLFKFVTNQFVLQQIFQHQNTQIVTDVQVMLNSATFFQFATLCFSESELRFWGEGSVLPVRTVYLRLPNTTDIFPSAFNFIFVPYTKLIAVYDANKSVLRLLDIDLGEVYKTSTKYLTTSFPTLKNYIQYNNLWKLLVVFTRIGHNPVRQTVSTLFANDTTVYKQFNVTYNFEIEAYVTCMHVLQGTEFVALGHSNGNITIHNILTSNIIRNITISSSPIIDILLRGNYLNILTKDAHDEIIFYQYSWQQNLYVENRLTNQAQCVQTCEAQQYEVSSYLACRSCVSDYNCKTCDASGCLTCNTGKYLDTITLSNGSTANSCVSVCSSSYFGLSYDNSDNTECVEICPTDIYDVDDRVCSQNTQIESTSEEKGVTGTLTTEGTTETLIVEFSNAVTFNTAHVLAATSTTVSYITDCVFLAVSGLKSSEFSYTAVLSSPPTKFLDISITLLIAGSIVKPKVTVTFEGQTCFKDSQYVPLSSDLLANGLSLNLPWNLVKLSEGQKKAAETIGQAATAASAVAAAAALPLALSNVMYVFWLLINVMQLVNFLLYLNVIYPSNVVNFFRAFSAFSMDWLPTFGLSSSSDSSKSTFLGQSIVDQVAADPFTRESMTSSIYLNGLNFIQTFIFLYIFLYIVRIIARVRKINYRKLPENAGIIDKVVATAQLKLEFTMIITTHQSSILKFSLAIFLQIMGFSSANAMNVIGFLIAIAAFAYLIIFLKNCYQKVNLNEMVVGAKIQDRVIDEKMRDKYEKYKLQYGILFMDINFIFYGRRNYHFFCMVKQVIITFVVVFFNTFTFACILTLLALYVMNALFLILYRPFDRKTIGYLSSVNEICMTVILCMVFYIHYVNESSGSTISASDTQKVINIGWVIISFLLVLFVFNIVSGIALEWMGIKEAFKSLTTKLKDLTKAHSVEVKDIESEKQNLKDDPYFNNIMSVKQTFSEGEKHNKIKDSFKSKSNEEQQQHSSYNSAEKSPNPRDLIVKMSELAESQSNVIGTDSISEYIHNDSSAIIQTPDSRISPIRKKSKKRKQNNPSSSASSRSQVQNEKNPEIEMADQSNAV